MKFRLALGLAALGATVAASGSAVGATATYVNQSAFLLQFPGATLESFEGQPASNFNLSYDFPNFSVSRSDGGFISVSTGGPTLSGNGFDTAGILPLILTFSFQKPLSAFGINILDLADGGSAVDLTISNSHGNSTLLLNDFSGPSYFGPAAAQFVGMWSSVPFHSVTIQITNVSGSLGESVYWDNAYFLERRHQGAVPEPTTWAMMILGFAGVGFMAYRRRNQGTALTAA